MLPEFIIPESNRVHIAWDDALLKPTGPQDQEFSERGDVDHIFQDLEASGKNKIAFYVHGGLVSGQAQFGQLPFHQRPENQILFNALSEVAYPIYFVWETGIKESMKSVGKDWGDQLSEDPVGFFKEHIAELAQTLLFKTILKYLPKVLADKAKIPPGGLGLVGRPEIEEVEIEKNLDRIPFYEPTIVEYEQFDDQDQQKFLQKLSADNEFMGYLAQVGDTSGLGLAEHPDREILRTSASPLMEALEADVQEAPAEPAKLSLVEDSQGLGFAPVVFLKNFAQTLGRLVLAVGARFVNKEDHGFVATITEEFLRLTNVNRLGILIWSQMKENAKEAYVQEDVNGIPHAGHYVLMKLSEYLMEHPDTQVSLIAHSAGAVHLSYFIEAADAIFNQAGSQMLQEFRFSNLIFLAPGVNFETFQRVLKHRPRVQRFHIYTMREADEMQDALLAGFVSDATLDSFLSKIYPCSLLYVVSGIVEQADKGDVPILGLARHLDETIYRGRDQGQDQFVQDAYPLILQWSTPSLPAVIWSHNNKVQLISETEMKKLSASGGFCAALRHGDFDSEPWTAASVSALLKI